MNYGFTQTAARPLPELNATLHEYEHTATGARLIWLDRPEENKTFGIAFTTLPFDDTGVFHILEHSVLCGSDKYPVKEPFVELMKHSMNTFLNALTFPDKTMYPISSRNDKDFINLMRVYLDAVFFPAIRHNPSIFGQEGWHYEFDENGTPSYKGVVFNEMKGAFADADELMEMAMNRALFPDTPYRYVSGGDPAAIPDLTYEKFLQTHKKFYSPGNATIILDGAVDMDTVLAVLGGEYLAEFDRGTRVAPPAMQPPVDGGAQTLHYEVGSEQEEAGRLRLAWGGVIGTYADRERLVAAQVLSDALCGSNQAPLCRAVLDDALAENVELRVTDGVSQPWLRLEIRNTTAEKAPAAEQAVFDTLRSLAQNGLDHAAVRASMANLEFQMRERDFGSYPQGLVFAFQILESTLYGGKPEQNLLVGDLFERLAQKLDDGWFEQLLDELLLHNPHRCRVTLVPDCKAGEARRAAEKARLDAESAAWTKEQREQLFAGQKALQAWQQAEDTPEQLATLPCLTLADIPDKPASQPLEQGEADGLPLLLHSLPTAGIVYTNLYFDADSYTEEELSTMAFACTLLTELPTAHHTAKELNQQLRLLCGDMTCRLQTFTRQDGSYTVKLCVGFSALGHNLQKAAELAAELLTETRFEPEQESAVRDRLRQTRVQLQEGLTMSGHMVGVTRAAAQLYGSYVADDCTGGLALYEWVRQTDDAWDWPTLRARLAALLQSAAAQNRLTVSVTADDAADAAKPLAKVLAAALPQQPVRPAVILQPRGVRREAVIIPADIAFACRAGNMAAQGVPYGGSWKLAANIISLGYLWNAVRVQGGAYGTGLLVRDSGLAGCYSYRDPAGVQSLQTYLQAPDFLREFCQSSPDLTGFIIGAVSDAEPLLTPRMRGTTADSLYWKGITYEQHCLRRRQLLQAAPADLAALAEPLQKALEQGGVCLVAGKNQLEDGGYPADVTVTV